MLIAPDVVFSNAAAAALHVAVEGGNIDMMTRVLELGADVDKPDGVYIMGYEVCYTPLLRAIERDVEERGGEGTKKEQEVGQEYD